MVPKKTAMKKKAKNGEAKKKMNPPKPKLAVDDGDESPEEQVVKKPKLVGKAAGPKGKPGNLKGKLAVQNGKSDGSKGNKLQKKNTQAGKPQKKVAPKKVAPEPEDDDEDDDEEDDDDEEMAAENEDLESDEGADEEDDDEMDDDEEEVASPAKATKKKAVSKAIKKVEEAPEDEDDEDEDEDDEEEDEDDDAEEEVAPPVKTMKKKAVSKAVKKVEAEEGDEDDDEEGEDEEDDEEGEDEDDEEGEDEDDEEGEDEEDDEEGEDEEDDEEGDEEDMEEDEVESTANKKRKREKDATGSPAKKPKTEKSGTCFVGKLAPELTSEALKKFFEKHGIKLSDVRKRDNANFAFIDLEDSSELDKALELSGTKCKGTEIVIRREGDKPERVEKDRSLDLFVKNIEQGATTESLKEIFTKAKEIRLVKDHNTGSLKGFGFMTFESAEEVQEAIDEHQGVEYLGQELYLDKCEKPQHKKEERGPGLKGQTKVLFVKNLSYQVNGDNLKEAFENATAARVAMFPDTGKSRGFGFVEFESPEAAQEACESMQGEQLQGRALQLDYSTELKSGPPSGDFRIGAWKGDRGRGGGFRGGRGRGGGRGGFRGGMGGFRGGRGGPRGGRGGFRGGRGGFRGGRGGYRRDE